MQRVRKTNKFFEVKYILGLKHKRQKEGNMGGKNKIENNRPSEIGEKSGRERAKEGQTAMRACSRAREMRDGPAQRQEARTLLVKHKRDVSLVLSTAVHH